MSAIPPSQIFNRFNGAGALEQGGAGELPSYEQSLPVQYPPQAAQSFYDYRDPYATAPQPVIQNPYSDGQTRIAPVRATLFQSRNKMCALGTITVVTLAGIGGIAGWRIYQNHKAAQSYLPARGLADFARRDIPAPWSADSTLAPAVPPMAEAMIPAVAEPARSGRLNELD